MMRRMDLRVLADHATVSVNFADQLSIQIEQTEKQERATGDSRKPVSNLFVQREPEQSQKQTEHSSKKDMPAPGECGDRERLRMVPSLRPRRQDERQPVRRNRRVKERHGKSGDRDGRENGFVHNGEKCGRSLSASPFRTKIIELVGFEPMSCRRGDSSTISYHYERFTSGWRDL